MAEKTTNPLTCKQCGYANEGERVYCHNCGTKLDRSLLPTLGEPEESLEKKQKRIRKIVMPTRGFFAGAGKTFCYTMLSSILVAVLILIAMPPDNVPKPVNTDELPDTSPSMDLENASQANAPQKLSWTQSDINTYLQSKLKAGDNNIFLGDEIKFSRLYVNSDEDALTLTDEETVFGHPLYFSVDYRLAIDNKKLVATVKGGNFGRLQIHPNLMQNLAIVLQSIWNDSAIKQDKRMLDGCQSIEVHKDHVDVVTLPEAAP